MRRNFQVHIDIFQLGDEEENFFTELGLRTEFLPCGNQQAPWVCKDSLNYVLFSMRLF